MKLSKLRDLRDLFGIVVQPLDLHLVNVGSIPTGPTHGEVCVQPHPGDVLKSAPNVRESPRSGLNLEGRLSDPQVVLKGPKPMPPSGTAKMDHRYSHFYSWSKWIHRLRTVEESTRHG